jgi:hypothetical protein
VSPGSPRPVKASAQGARVRRPSRSGVSGCAVCEVRAAAGQQALGAPPRPGPRACVPAGVARSLPARRGRGRPGGSGPVARCAQEPEPFPAQLRAAMTRRPRSSRTCLHRRTRRRNSHGRSRRRTRVQVLLAAESLGAAGPLNTRPNASCPPGSFPAIRTVLPAGCPRLAVPGGRAGGRGGGRRHGSCRPAAFPGGAIRAM